MAATRSEFVTNLAGGRRVKISKNPRAHNARTLASAEKLHPVISLILCVTYVSSEFVPENFREENCLIEQKI